MLAGRPGGVADYFEFFSNDVLLGKQLRHKSGLESQLRWHYVAPLALI